MIAQAAVPSRYHALDALRAAMMFLGIYLHATVAYSPVGGWPYKPAQLTTTLDFSVGLIHVFRMPVFYVMAGFFAALLLQRYGSAVPPTTASGASSCPSSSAGSSCFPW